MTKKGTSCGIPGLRLRRKAGLPLAQQICDVVRADVEEGKLRPGSSLPSSRALARQLGVSRNTVIAAYEELGVLGFIVTVKGSRTLVAGGTRSLAPRRWGELMKGSGYPSKVRACSDPDGTPILVCSTGK